MQLRPFAPSTQSTEPGFKVECGHRISTQLADNFALHTYIHTYYLFRTCRWCSTCMRKLGERCKSLPLACSKIGRHGLTSERNNLLSLVAYDGCSRSNLHRRTWLCVFSKCVRVCGGGARGGGIGVYVRVWCVKYLTNHTPHTQGTPISPHIHQGAVVMVTFLRRSPLTEVRKLPAMSARTIQT